MVFTEAADLTKGIGVDPDDMPHKLTVRCRRPSPALRGRLRGWGLGFYPPKSATVDQISDLIDGHVATPDIEP
jgi:hypothetical protein